MRLDRLPHICTVLAVVLVALVATVLVLAALVVTRVRALGGGAPRIGERRTGAVRHAVG